MDKHFEDMMPYPHQLELEKICYPLLLMKKKTYSAVMFTDPEHKGKTVAKGSSVVRRDQVACIQKVTQEVQDMLMKMETKQVIEDKLRRLYLGACERFCKHKIGMMRGRHVFADIL